MSKIWVMQHVRPETLGTIANALESRGISAYYIRTFDGQSVPKEMGDTDGLIVMGGPMGVYDYAVYPFLSEEMHLIEQALREEKPVLGVCLGSQLLAAALGAPVKKGKQKEIGWHSIKLTESAKADNLWMNVDPSFIAYHWHGDIFEVPDGATSLASSDLTECQAFRYGRNAYGFLFHMEVTENIIDDMVGTFSDELREAGVDGREIIRDSANYLPNLQRIGGSVFQRWADLLQK